MYITKYEDFDKYTENDYKEHIGKIRQYCYVDEEDDIFLRKYNDYIIKFIEKGAWDHLPPQEETYKFIFVVCTIFDNLKCHNRNILIPDPFGLYQLMFKKCTYYLDDKLLKRLIKETPFIITPLIKKIHKTIYGKSYDDIKFDHIINNDTPCYFIHESPYYELSTKYINADYFIKPLLVDIIEENEDIDLLKVCSEYNAYKICSLFTNKPRYGIIEIINYYIITDDKTKLESFLRKYTKEITEILSEKYFDFSIYLTKSTYNICLKISKEMTEAILFYVPHKKSIIEEPNSQTHQK